MEKPWWPRMNRGELMGPSLGTRPGVLPSLDSRGKESEKWQEGRVTWLDVEGSRYPRAATAATRRKSGPHDSSDHGIKQGQVPRTPKGQIYIFVTRLKRARVWTSSKTGRMEGSAMRDLVVARYGQAVAWGWSRGLGLSRGLELSPRLFLARGKVGRSSRRSMSGAGEPKWGADSAVTRGRPSWPPTPHDKRVMPTFAGRPPAAFTLPQGQGELWTEG
ncbi:hypothetical protein CRG98_021654 [Punica granatum]|uniref:Uncharacterized protein n=1 Tax=Punica granatum TaxID=22663 RepID=A0A2I0JNU1_PUNGR|nr:hypothetical protein CRG98_021654 [Punica granatum]